MADSPPESEVVLLRKDRNKSRAEGKLIRVAVTGGKASLRHRYDVLVEGLKIVPYKSEPLDRWGVNLI